MTVTFSGGIDEGLPLMDERAKNSPIQPFRDVAWGEIALAQSRYCEQLDRRFRVVVQSHQRIEFSGSLCRRRIRDRFLPPKPR